MRTKTAITAGLLLVLALAAILTVWMLRHRTVVLTAADNGRTVVVPVGAMVQIQLAGGVIGYGNWRLEPIQGESLDLDAASPSQVDRSASMIGSPGVLVWTFHAVREGHAQLRLSFLDRKGKLTSTFAVAVDVRD